MISCCLTCSSPMNASLALCTCISIVNNFERFALEMCGFEGFADQRERRSTMMSLCHQCHQGFSRVRGPPGAGCNDTPLPTDNG